MSPSDLGRAAVWYGQKGYPLFPLHAAAGGRCSCGIGSCEAPGKHPRIARWPQQATTAVALIRAWWHRWPEANIALVTGEASGFVVLDVDPRHGGELALTELQGRFGEWPATVTARTGGGGWHFFFRHPGVRVPNSSGLLGPGLDVRGDGGYVVAPPSLHASGYRYAWDGPRHPATTEIAPLPTWLLALLVSPPRPKAALGPKSPLADVVLNGVGEGRRNTSLARLAGHLLRRRVEPFVTLGLLRTWNLQSCRPPLAEEELARTIESIADSERRRRRGR
ncbi:MAG: bifunctional DNA primase/polymerase [Acidobacteriota bacterium]